VRRRQRGGVTQCRVDATVPLQRYVATITLKPVTDGQRTFWHWESSFATPPGRERELREMVAQGVYEAGFDNLRRHLLHGSDLRAPGAAPLPTALPLPTRRFAVNRYGDADQLAAEDASCPAPAAGEMRIRQRAIGVNYIDIYLRKGWIPPMLAEGGTPGIFADAVLSLTGGADLLIDGIGAAARDENFAALARRGHWISLGQATGALDAVDANALLAKSIAFSRPVVFDYMATRAALPQRASRLWAALADGSIKLPPIERHWLESAAAAHARLESRATSGALVLIA
jgi:hypothetical protein